MSTTQSPPRKRVRSNTLQSLNNDQESSSSSSCAGVSSQQAQHPPTPSSSTTKTLSSRLTMIHDETSQGAGGDSGDIGGPVGAAAGSSNSGGGSGGRRDAMRKSRQKNKHSKNGGGGSMARRTSQNGSSSAATSGSAAVAVQVVQDSDDSTLSDIGSEDEDGEMFEDSQEELPLDFGGGEGCDLPAAVLRKIPRLAASGNGGGLSRAEGEVVRLIGQYLRNIGLRNSAAVLMTEAGCQLDHSIAATFRKYVMNGEWSGAVTILEELRNHLENPEHAKEMKFLLLEQKYLELLYKGNSIEALKVLQTELTPLKHNQARTHELSSYLMFSSREDLVRVTTTTTAANGSGSGGSLADITDVTTRRNLMDRLQEFLPASIMLPPKRLQTLLNQAAEFQIDRCLYHNRPSAAPAGLQALGGAGGGGGCLADPPFTTHLPQNSISPSSNINHHHHSSSNEFKIDPSFLAVDHQCSKEDFPCETIQVLTDHCEEIWYTKFSPDGRRLATGSKDNTVIIWDFDPATLTLKHNKSLERHHAAAFFAWSPDSTRIAVCGPEESDEVFIWNVETGALECKISNATEDSLVTVSWSPDGRRIACGGTRGQFYQCDAKGAVIDSWEGVRVQCLSYRRDGKSVLAADTHHRIRSYNFEDLSDASVLQEDHGIMSFSVDDSDRYALLNVADQGLHMWDIEEKCLVRKFVGVQQGFYTVYSCFGGADQNFIASGSEDHKVYIFHVRREAPIAVLSGHSRTVSCVSWNPVFPQVLVSGSDDGTVRVWAPAEKFRKKRGFSVAAGSGSTGNGSVSNGQDCQNNHNGVV